MGVHVDGKTGSKSGKEAELVNLNPSKDLISGSIILAALFRVFVSSTSDSAGNGKYKAAIIDLSKSLNDALVQKNILLSTVKKELLWADAALNECEAALALVGEQEDGFADGLNAMLGEAKATVAIALEGRRNVIASEDFANEVTMN
jgi:hypothetical protein